MSEPIYFDYSTLAGLRNCEEYARLRYEEDLVPLAPSRAAPAFGTAFHAAVATWHSARAILSDPRPSYPNPDMTWFLESLSAGNTPIDIAKLHFIKLAKREELPIPIDNEADERRSIERGLALLECYFEIYGQEHYEVLTRPDTGEPYVEIGFAIYVMEWRGRPVFLVGRIDAIKRNRVDNRIYINETKTTTQGLGQFVKQVRPNHQVTTYHWAAKELLKLDVAGTVWDAVFVSSRKPDPRSKDMWMRDYGIDKEKDFCRTETRRFPVDLEEYLFDLQLDIIRYLERRESGLKRWVRNAPGACHSYGGCMYRELCSMNLAPAILRTKFRKEKWEPWKGIVTGA